MENTIRELSEEAILKRIGFVSSSGKLKMYVIRGVGYVGAVEELGDGVGAFGQGSPCVYIIKNFITFWKSGRSLLVANEFLIKRLTKTTIDDKRIIKQILAYSLKSIARSQSIIDRKHQYMKTTQ